MDPGRRKFPGRRRLRRRGSDDESQSARIRRRHLRFENAEAARRRVLFEGERDPPVPGRPFHFHYRIRSRSKYRALLQPTRSEISRETVLDLSLDRLRQNAAELIRAATYANSESPQSAKRPQTC